VDDQEEEKEVDIRIRLEKEMFKVSGDKSSCITIVLEVTKQSISWDGQEACNKIMF
jgi:hypothetical protein